MSVVNVLELAIAMIVAAGVTSAIVAWALKLVGSTLAKGLVEKFKSDLQRELESYKTKLKKSEFIFQKEYEAASEFMAMKIGFYPSQRYAEMDWTDACEEIAGNLERIEQQLRAFISKHGAIMGKDTLEALIHAEGIAAANKFGGRDLEPSREAVGAADELWNKLVEIETKLRDVVLSQSSA